MRIQGSDDHDIRDLIERGSSSWNGPSPSVRQSRWAAESERRRRVHGARLVAMGLGVAALALGSVAVLAISRAPDAAASVARLMSHVFAGPTGPPPAAAPPQSVPAVSPSAEASATPAPLRSTPRPSRAPVRWNEPGGPERSPSPAPSTSTHASPIPTPPDK